MSELLPDDQDRHLERLFSAAADPVADDGFSEAVMRRVARHAWRRRLVLATAGAAGLAIAIRPAWQLSLELGRQLVSLGSRGPELAGALQSPLAIAAGLLLIGIPGILHWLED